MLWLAAFKRHFCACNKSGAFFVVLDVANLIRLGTRDTFVSGLSNGLQSTILEPATNGVDSRASTPTAPAGWRSKSMNAKHSATTRLAQPKTHSLQVKLSFDTWLDINFVVCSAPGSGQSCCFSFRSLSFIEYCEKYVRDLQESVFRCSCALTIQPRKPRSYSIKTDFFPVNASRTFVWNIPTVSDLCFRHSSQLLQTLLLAIDLSATWWELLL